MARRIGNLSFAFRRALAKLGYGPGSPQRVAVGATVSALMTADELPGAGDSRTTFAPGVAHVRRVSGRNLWILYRFDDARVDVLMIRETPPVPHDDDGGVAG
jgi:hypothetical protein